MHSLRKTFFFVSAILLMTMAVFPVAAQIESVDGSDFGIAPGESPKDALRLGVQIVNALLLFVGLAAAVFLIYGGIQYISAAGDEQKAETAKRTILYAVIGLLVVGLSAAIVNFVVASIR